MTEDRKFTDKFKLKSFEFSTHSRPGGLSGLLVDDVQRGGESPRLTHNATVSAVLLQQGEDGGVLDLQLCPRGLSVGGGDSGLVGGVHQELELVRQVAVIITSESYE